MTTRRTALAIPEELLEQVDEAARAKGLSRNRFVLTVLRRAIGSRKDAEITRKLNEIFADEELGRQQIREAEAFQAASGVSWDDESW
ncbi:MAG: ribbon-helix-helix protein, CopG family [Myxococcales bacterium]|nr:ribbon-helix-helix protein, CopG family [Myxococcales bacterium]